MSTTEDEIKIDLDAPVEPVKAAEKTPPVVDPPDDLPDPEAGIKKLQKQLEDERALRLAAERGRDEAMRSEVVAKTQSHENQMALLNTALENVKATKASLKTEYAAALAASDFDKVSEINDLMGENNARLVQLESGKKILERQPKPQATPPSDPVEAFVSTMTPKSAEWVRAHPRYATEERLTQRMIRSHWDALDDGLKADSPEYFEYIENRLGIKSDTVKVPDDIKDPDDPTSAAAAPRRAAPPAAPASRSGNGAGDRRNTMTLTAAEVEAAQISGLTPEEYAKNKVAIAKQKQH